MTEAEALYLNQRLLPAITELYRTAPQFQSQAASLKIQSKGVVCVVLNFKTKQTWQRC